MLATARVGHSGQVCAAGVLKALSWRTGERLDASVHRGAVVIAARLPGRNVIGIRDEIGLPASARQMCGIAPGSIVLVAALPAHDLLVAHPASAMIRLLGDLHHRVI